MSNRILVIDDEPNVGHLIKDCLEPKGYEVLVSLSAEEGLDVLDAHHPTLVLLDVNLPGIGGLDCLNEILKRAPETIVVILSGMSDETIAKEAIRRGAYDYFTKPFDLMEFEGQILTRLFPLS